MRLDRDTLRTALARAVPPIRGRAVLERDARPAAVALPVYLGEEPTVLAVLRAGTMRDHAGEVGFPGGKQDPADVDLVATALRELEEETGLRDDEVEVLGVLMSVPVITGRYLIHPFVTEVKSGRQPTSLSSEIARLLRLPLADWLERGRTIHAVRSEWQGHTLVTPHFELEGCVLYGASAYVFYELLCKIAAELSLRLPDLHVVEELPWGDRYG